MKQYICDFQTLTMSGGASSLDGKLLVAAIDFGTAYSGYAYSFRNDYKLDPLKITTNHWTGAGSQTMSQRPLLQFYSTLTKLSTHLVTEQKRNIQIWSKMDNTKTGISLRK